MPPCTAHLVLHQVLLAAAFCCTALIQDAGWLHLLIQPVHHSTVWHSMAQHSISGDEVRECQLVLLTEQASQLMLWCSCHARLAVSSSSAQPSGLSHCRVRRTAGCNCIAGIHALLSRRPSFTRLLSPACGLRAPVCELCCHLLQGHDALQHTQAGRQALAQVLNQTHHITA